MHILVAHNRYRIAGGEDGVVDAESELLTQHGVKVSRFEVSNSGINGWTAAARVGLRSGYSKKSARSIEKIIVELRPDVLHVHNFFPLLTTSVYDAAHRHDVPVVQTLHNYRTICGAGTLLRKGKVCTKCLKGSSMWAVIHGCYRHSRLASAGVANMIRWNRAQNTWNSKVDKFICLTEFSRRIFVEAGFPEGKLAIKPNFVREPTVEPRGSGGYALYVGRLSVEKGIDILLDAWQEIGPRIPLRIAGDGPLTSQVQVRADGKNIRYLGRLSQAAVLEQMRGAGCLVFPSLSYEGFPLTILEAFSVGTPVVASRIGSLAEIVKNNVNGLLFEPGVATAMAAALLRVMSTPGLRESLEHGARQDYLNHYTPERNFRYLQDIYLSALGNGAQVQLEA